MKNNQTKKPEEKKELKQRDVLREYASQTKESENVHFEHVDWTYNDSSCCC